MLHVGHVTYLQQARQQGDCLVVALNSDSSIRGLGKGDDRPIFAQEQRAMMLASLEAVDYVVVFNEQTPHNVIETVKPDLLVKGGTYLPEEIVGKEVVEAYGGEVPSIGRSPRYLDHRDSQVDPRRTVSAVATIRSLRGKESGMNRIGECFYRIGLAMLSWRRPPSAHSVSNIPTPKLSASIGHYISDVLDGTDLMTPFDSP